MGLVGGQRAMTPLATVAIAGARGELQVDGRLGRIVAHPLVAAGALALAVAEIAGDKQKSAPDRIVPVGLAARFIASSIAGAALAPIRRRWLGAGIAGVTAIAASYPGWRLRIASMSRHGQTATGFVEDAAIVGGAAAIVRGLAKPAAA
jgi:uncharacterized membrane protein